MVELASFDIAEPSRRCSASAMSQTKDFVETAERRAVALPLLNYAGGTSASSQVPATLAFGLSTFGGTVSRLSDQFNAVGDIVVGTRSADMTTELQ